MFIGEIWMKSENKPLRRNEDIVVQDSDGEILIYDLKINKALCLNETSALVWQACDGTKSVAEISQLLSKKTNAPVTEDLVWFAIDDLKKEKLIANSEDITSNFEGMNRRNVIKKIGMGAMIALPIVMGLVAPTAANAASPGRVVGSATAPGDVCGGQAGNQAARAAACQAQQGPNCASGNATFVPQSCTEDGTTSTFNCQCT